MADQGAQSRDAAWDVLVLPVVIEAPTEEIARIEFIQALAEDMSLIRVQSHAEDIDVGRGDDAIGI